MGFLDKLKFWQKKPVAVIGPPEPTLQDTLIDALDAREIELQEQVRVTESPTLRAKLTARVSEIVYLRDEVRKSKTQ